ncbi:hypothetical protein D3C83_180160 [compost metagenome]
MADRGMDVPEDALQRVAVVDAVGAGHFVQRVHRFHAEPGGQGAIALAAKAPFHVERAA